MMPTWQYFIVFQKHEAGDGLDRFYSIVLRSNGIGHGRAQAHASEEQWIRETGTI